MRTINHSGTLCWLSSGVPVSQVSNFRRQTCCARGVHACIIAAAVLGAIDYKRTFARTYVSEEDRLEAYSRCHLRSAKRVLRALLANGGKSFVIRHTEERARANFISRGIHKVRAAHGISVSSPTSDLLVVVFIPWTASYCLWSGRAPCALCKTNAIRRHTKMSMRSSYQIWGSRCPKSLTTSTPSRSVLPVWLKFTLLTIGNLARP